MMATQTAFVSDMQITPSQEQQTVTHQTIIAAQPTQRTSQGITGHQFVVTNSTNEVLKDSTTSTNTVTLQTAQPSQQQQQQQQQQSVFSNHLQYVTDNDNQQTIFANGTMPYRYSDSTTMYTQAPQVQGTTYFTAPAGSTAGVVVSTGTVGGVQTIGSSNSVIGGSTVLGNTTGLLGTHIISGSPIITNQGNTYVVAGHMDDHHLSPISHMTRASPATVSEHVQWLIDNYETAEGVSLPRSTLYAHYLRHCTEQKLDPVNAASFGKLIRSVFLGLRTRRLGTRGNSKYHYYGIRIKSTSPLNMYQDDVGHTAMRQQPLNTGKRFKPNSVQPVGEGKDVMSTDDQSTVLVDPQPQTQTQQHQQFLGDASLALPSFDEINFNENELPEGITKADIVMFKTLYREHCEAVLDVVVNLQFSLIEALWQTFWRNQPADSTATTNEADPEKRLAKTKLLALSKSQPILNYIKHYDHVLYQGLVEVLIPDVLRPIPSALTQAIRNFAKSLETWLKNSMTGIPHEMYTLKNGVVTAFAQTLRRYTSLNHLAQAARAVLQNTSQISQMLSDLNRVDFANVQEQASWVCQCEDQMVQRLEQDFKTTLQQQNSLEQWAAWLEGVVTQVLKPHENSPNFAKAARQFLLKWSFYSSMVIRDLTLRSAASFGSFHLIRLLYDEYMFYLIEHRVASATGETPIAVMGRFIFCY
ncbi:transcription factor RFX3-like isoform X1 [Anneissia japonica]|uniref:transcription factor RFX3-like isoform X1 n=1 Tax=Anneissia japonica TaxID=1529436 RepID=UPI0014257ACC|nr:transcription factor RFX3-like isoform X1 [Anneissia japonica]XP_033116311.1 transcription factor RFX3-like isoform X1 [Anneissia japonica]